jgi:16S rRNA (guanine1207-N2)-methyltransferase
MLEALPDVLVRLWRVAPPPLPDGAPVLFLGAVPLPDGEAADALARARVTWVQGWAPDAVRLGAAGHVATPEPPPVPEGDTPGAYALTLVLPGRTREAVLADLGRAVLHTRPGGVVAAALPNRLGAPRYARHLAELLGEVGQDTKARCRLFWGTVGPDTRRDLARAWVEEGAPREGDDGWWTVPGAFSWEGVDKGTRLLSRALPATLPAEVMDLGAGLGHLSRAVLKGSRGVRTLHLVEADYASLQLAVRNLTPRAEAAGVQLVPHWVDATAHFGLPTVDAVVSNPPFHEGGRTDPAVGQAFLRAAARGLRKEGELWVVANARLPYEATLREQFAVSEEVKVANGFKILRAARPVTAWR